MKRLFIHPCYVRLVLIVIASLVYLNASSQGGIKPDSAKARKELESYNHQNQKKAESLGKSVFRDTAIWRMRKEGDLLMITFNEKSTITARSFFQNFSNKLKIRSKDQFRLAGSDSDDVGYTHYSYEQYYQGIKVMGGQMLLHEKNGKMDFANGKFYNDLTIDVTPSISKETAIAAAIRFVAAKKYQWQTGDPQDSAAAYPKPELIISPKSGLFASENFRLCYQVLIVSEIPYNKIDIFVDAHTGEVINSISQVSDTDVPNTIAQTDYYSQQTITTDHTNGVYRLEESATRPISTLNMLNKTVYSAAVDFTSKNNNWTGECSILSKLNILTVNSSWRDLLEDFGISARPDIYVEIKDANNNVLFGRKDAYFPNTTLPLTINLNNITLLTGSTYTITILDSDLLTRNDTLGSFVFTTAYGTSLLSNKGTLCSLTGRKGLSGAVDAHWCMEKVYDYYVSTFGRRSFDNRNGKIMSYVHANAAVFPGGNPSNAFWNGTGMTFGDGDGKTYGAMTALDICGHEFTHGVVQYNGHGGLINQHESGALNESFADIFGTAIEFHTLGTAGNWTIGEKVFLHGGYLRSLQNPKSAGQPDTYGGINWLSPDCGTPNPTTNDNCWVHNNNGVQNKWFYLLSAGGSSTNDNTDHYNVPAIGIDKAAEIAYYNLTSLTTTSATYNDVYHQSLKAAEMRGYTNPSTEYRAVRESWFAVGVAKRPVIDTFTPATGNIGTTVTITGKNFTGLSYVGFNDTYVPAPYFTVSTDETQITVNVPYGATTGYISIIAGYDTVKSATKFIICNGLTVDVSSTNGTSYTATATGGIAPYVFSLDNINFQNGNVFTGLATGADYTVYAKDSTGCAGQLTFRVNDSLQCNVQSGSGGQGTTFTTQILGASPGSVDVSYQMYTIPDQMDIYYNNALVASTGALVSGGGDLIFNYSPLPGGPYHCIIRMYAPNSGTAWDFIAYCPVSTIVSSAVIPAGSTGLSGQSILYPNPASDFAYIRLKDMPTQTSIVLSDVTGKLLWQTTHEQDGTIVVPVKNLAPGIYIITLTDSSGQKKSMKLIRSN